MRTTLREWGIEAVGITVAAINPGDTITGDRPWHPVAGPVYVAHDGCGEAEIRTRGPITVQACPADAAHPHRIVRRIDSLADWQQDGDTDLFDLLAYLADFRAGTPDAAGYDGEPAHSADDLLAYLGRWREAINREPAPAPVGDGASLFDPLGGA